MGRTATKSAVEDIIDVDAVEEMNEMETKATKKSINENPLLDSDEIEVVSLVSNVSYKDSKTLDTYRWDEIGHVEYMTFDTLKNMWRNNKGYFKNLWLKPNDERVINKFGLKPTFEKYEYLMNGSNYTKKNINAVCEAIKATPIGLKMSICDKVKSLVISGEISNVSVIRELEKSLHIDLIDFLD